MTPEEVDAELQRIAPLDFSHPDDVVTRAIGQLRFALEESRRLGVGLVAFAA